MFFWISTDVKLLSCLCELLYVIFPCVWCSGFIRSSSINNWQPLQIPTDKVSGLAKKFFKAVLAFSLYLKAPAQPFALPKTSEFENPPTAPINCMSSNVSLPEIRSVICTSLTSKPAKNMAFAISRSELLPFSRSIAAFGLFPLKSASLPVKFAGNL